jgi:hypothetical protein
VIRHRFLPSAREELNDAAEFYDSRVSGLGLLFLENVDRSVEMVRENPRLGVQIGHGFRRVILSRFPFAIIYVARSDEVIVVAIAHQRRRPGYWRRGR